MAKPDMYTVGGTVQAGSGLYISRAADDELLRLCHAGRFAYVLTARQMGKSSLMIRAAQSLAAEGVISIIIDLSQFGVNIKPEEWHFGILTKIADTIELDIDIKAWWDANAHLGVTHRMIRFYEKVLLSRVSGRVVIFIDEIDTTLSLTFTDDFYAAIRSIHNARATNQDFRRLSFVLIGVATPGDLMRDPHRTPFNIGESVELTDFNFDEVLPLAHGLGLQSGKVRRVLSWVMKWTGGHPYLSQRLFQELARQGQTGWTEERIDRAVSDTFLGEMSEQDKNLQFVRDMLTKRAPNMADVLATYQDVLLGSKSVIDEKQSVTKNHLKLSGVVRRDRSFLVVRNLIYKTAFNISWIQSQASESIMLTAPPKGGDRVRVFIGGTVRDLPEHRKEVIDACLRQGMTPMMMEHLPANDADAIQTCIALVNQCDIYIGVIAHRYGYVPVNYATSITEMEYEQAVKRGIPRLVFLMHEDHPVKLSDIERGEGALKLDGFKERLLKEQIVTFFRSPADLRAHVINALSQYRERGASRPSPGDNIPAPPEAFIVHPYTLLQTRQLVGRQAELNLLTDWVAKPSSEVHKAGVLSVVAIGGMGKSALTWAWFNDIAPREIELLAGRMWWSFYESNATFENFVARALAYATRRALDEVQKIPAPERETQLLAALDREPFLIVLDGLERILIAYARTETVQLSDDEVDKQTANFAANSYGLPESAAKSFTGEHRLRKTTDPRAGAFLRKLANVRAARILVSTRLYPADLETTTGVPLPGCSAIFLTGMVDEDVLKLWRAFGVSGARDTLLPLFNRVGNHPLLIQALASEVARYRRAPGDFEQWRRDHPDFDPFSLPLTKVNSHVLEFALRGLDERARRILQIIAAFRLPPRYDTLAALLIGEEKAAFADEREMDEALTELEDRGLLGWDKHANRYDLHPIVRGVVWSGLVEGERRKANKLLYEYFEALPMLKGDEIESLEDLAPAVELYSTLIGLGRYNDAWAHFSKRMASALFYRLSAYRQAVELLEILFPDGTYHLPPLDNQNEQACAVFLLALGKQFTGQPRLAARLYRVVNTISSELQYDYNLGIGLCSLSHALRQSGSLFESEAAARRALLLMRRQGRPFQETNLDAVRWSLHVRGLSSVAELAAGRAQQIDETREADAQTASSINALSAQVALWQGAFSKAWILANRMWEQARVLNYESDFIRAAQVQGEAALGLNDFPTADERLHHALTRARIVNLAEAELAALISLAELRRRQGDLKMARELLDDVWETAERGPYPLIHADACNVLAQVERDAGHTAGAVEAATRAYQLAWCDGPPFAYHWGLEKARGLLAELGAEEPLMPAFDESKFEPMPEVEIDPADEFGVGNDKGRSLADET